MRPHRLAVLGCVLLAACEVSNPDESLTAPASPARGKATTGVTITAVGPASGAAAQDVDDEGVVTGNFSPQVGPVLQAFVWRPAQPRGTVGIMAELPSLTGRGVMATAINNAGSIVGASPIADG